MEVERKGRVAGVLLRCTDSDGLMIHTETREGCRVEEEKSALWLLQEKRSGTHADRSLCERRNQQQREDPPLLLVRASVLMRAKATQRNVHTATMRATDTGLPTDRLVLRAHRGICVRSSTNQTTGILYIH